MKWISFFVLIFVLSACTSTARYKSIKKSRQNNHQSQKKSYSRHNSQLQNYIQDWIGVPYKYGGLSKRGIDCSGFTLTIYSEVYNYKLPRTALDQFKTGRKINASLLTEGDLVFFRGVRGTGIDHVGIYLENNKFIHASTSAGVIISDLSEKYYNTRFVGACRY